MAQLLKSFHFPIFLVFAEPTESAVDPETGAGCGDYEDYVGILRLESGRGQCSICGRVFSIMRNARRHFTTMHMQKDTPIGCPICKKVFIRKELMKDHLRRKHKLYKETYNNILNNPALMLLSSLSSGEVKTSRVGRPPKKPTDEKLLAVPAPQARPTSSAQDGSKYGPIAPTPDFQFSPNLNVPLSSLWRQNPATLCQASLESPPPPTTDEPVSPPITEAQTPPKNESNNDTLGENN